MSSLELTIFLWVFFLSFQVPLWKGCLHLLPMFGEESYPTYMKMPTAVLENVLQGNKKLGKSLSAHVKLNMDFDAKALYVGSTIKLLETWK